MATLSSEQNCSVDDFIKKRLKSCQVTSKGMITGYLDSRKAYDELLRDLQVLGYRYSVRSCYVGKTDTGNLQYKVLSPDLQIPFTGSPFHVEGTTYFLCTHGFRYYKSKAVSDQETHDGVGGDGTKRKRRKTNESIKLGCPAKMTVKCIRVYPDYKTNSNSWRRKCDVLKRLKADLKLYPPPHYELNFWISVSSEDSHIHERSTTQRIQTLHPDLISEIHRLVKSGVTSVPAIKSHLASFVQDMFLKSSIRPDIVNTAFYPSDKSIYNHVYDAKATLREAEKKYETLRSLSPSASTSASPGDVSTPHQEPEVDGQLDSGLAVVPVFDSTFADDWQDQTVLPTNFVQVLKTDGTLMLMVTQPLDESISGRLENPDIDAPINIENVTIDDNIYTVITDTSEEILHFNNDSSILMSQPSSDQEPMGQVLTVEENNESVLLNSDKNALMDMDRVITMEGNVIVGVRKCDLVDDRDDNSCNEDHSQFLYVGEDSQAELLKEVQNQSKEFTALSELPHIQSVKSETASIFPSEIENQILEKVTSDRSEERKGSKTMGKTLKNSKNRKRIKRHSDQGEDRQSTDKVYTSRKALRDAAQDIINMSYSSTNSLLLHEMVVVFEKCRRHLHEEIESKKKTVSNKPQTRASLFEESSRWESSVKTSPFSEKSMFSSVNKSHIRIRKTPVSKKKLLKSRGTLFSSSESSLDDYDDLIIND